MDIGIITGWIQLAIWIVGTVLFLGRLIVRRCRGEAVIPKWIGTILSSNVLFGGIIVVGLAASIVTQYLSYAYNHQTYLDDVTISAYRDGAVLKLVKEQTFENESVPLDGYNYDHCTFVNSCLLYDGGPYQLQSATFKDHWKVCVKDEPLKNYAALQTALRMYRTGVKHSSKSVMKDTLKTAN